MFLFYRINQKSKEVSFAVPRQFFKCFLEIQQDYVLCCRLCAVIIDTEKEQEDGNMQRLFTDHILRKTETLNGTWNFRIDPENRGVEEKWYLVEHLILKPF